MHLQSSQVPLFLNAIIILLFLLKLLDIIPLLWVKYLILKPNFNYIFYGENRKQILLTSIFYHVKLLTLSLHLSICHLFPCGLPGKESACNVGDLGSILGWEDPLEK